MGGNADEKKSERGGRNENKSLPSVTAVELRQYPGATPGMRVLAESNSCLAGQE